MPRRGRTARCRRAALILIGLAAAFTAGLPTALVALAAEDPIKLAVEPVGEPGSFFERSLGPGE